MWLLHMKYTPFFFFIKTEFFWKVKILWKLCSIVKQQEKEKYSNFNVENCVVMFIYWGTIKRYMDRDWTASFSIRFRNGTCIIILNKKYNIANSSCHFGSEALVHIIFFLVTDRSIYCHMYALRVGWNKIHQKRSVKRLGNQIT
jgi:hypothetical protein